MFSADSKLDDCFKRIVVECEFVEKSLFLDWFHTVCTDSKRAQTLFKFNLSHKLLLWNMQHHFCSVMCYIVLIWTLILLTLGNNYIVTLLFNWLKPVHYIPADKISASICIRVNIRCWMQILTSFVTFCTCRLWTRKSAVISGTLVEFGFYFTFRLWWDVKPRSTSTDFQTAALAEFCNSTTFVCNFTKQPLRPHRLLVFMGY